MTEPIGRNDVPLRIKGRPSKLPRIYKSANHPQRKEGNVYYYIQDVSPAVMQRAFDIENEMVIPHGPAELARALGEYFTNDLTVLIFIYIDYRLFRAQGRRNNVCSCFDRAFQR